MRVALVSDAWLPQTNGVVRTLRTTVETAETLGVSIQVIESSRFTTIPCPTYPEIRLAWRPEAGVERMLDELEPDAVHIATEGPLGHAARRVMMRRERPFTTSYHTAFPEYLRARVPLSPVLTYAYLRRFHYAAARTFVATPSLERTLEERGFRNLARWGRGVDVDLFRPCGRGVWDLPRPIAVYFGRVAVEKNLDAFLSLDLAGSKVVIGDGPDRSRLQARYPDAVFTGYKYGEDLARHVSDCDVFVFPSRTDTFGLVLLEAMACGLPVAAYPVTGPIDVVRDGSTGALDQDLGSAVSRALRLDRGACRAAALEHTWEAATRQLLSQLAWRDPARACSTLSRVDSPDPHSAGAAHGAAVADPVGGPTPVGASRT